MNFCVTGNADDCAYKSRDEVDNAGPCPIHSNAEGSTNYVVSGKKMVMNSNEILNSEMVKLKCINRSIMKMYFH